MQSPHFVVIMQACPCIVAACNRSPCFGCRRRRISQKDMEDERSSTHALAGSSILISVLCDASTLAAGSLLAFMFSLSSPSPDGQRAQTPDIQCESGTGARQTRQRLRTKGAGITNCVSALGALNPLRRKSVKDWPSPPEAGSFVRSAKRLPIWSICIALGPGSP